MAGLAISDKKAEDEKFLGFLPIIKSRSCDPRNFVRKAVNWALRQIRKKNKFLSKKAIHTAEQIEKIDPKSARWIVSMLLEN